MVLAKEQIRQIITGNGAHSITDADVLLCEGFYKGTRSLQYEQLSKHVTQSVQEHIM